MLMHFTNPRKWRLNVSISLSIQHFRENGNLQTTRLWSNTSLWMACPNELRLIILQIQRNIIVKCILKFWIPSLLSLSTDLTRKAFRLICRWNHSFWNHSMEPASKAKTEFLNGNYGDEITTDLLEFELKIWKTIFNDSKPLCFKDIPSTLGSLSTSFLLSTQPLHACTAERSFRQHNGWNLGSERQ